jgi:hypothetical protein
MAVYLSQAAIENLRAAASEFTITAHMITNNKRSNMPSKKSRPGVPDVSELPAAYMVREKGVSDLDVRAKEFDPAYPIFCIDCPLKHYAPMNAAQAYVHVWSVHVAHGHKMFDGHKGLMRSVRDMFKANKQSQAAAKSA